MASEAVESLIKTFSKLPGIGSRSARRVVLDLLRHKESKMEPLLAALTRGIAEIKTCDTCGNIDGVNPCDICSNEKRDGSTICVVEDISDLWAIERSHMYNGLYHVLGGTLSAIDGRGPDALNIPTLLHRAAEEKVSEVILATNATVDGQTTAHYLTSRLEDCNVTISKLAQGIPMGGELDYLDDGTLGAALKARKAF